MFETETDRQTTAEPRPQCGDGCQKCADGRVEAAPGELAGRRLALSAAATFLLPLAGAIAGSVLAGRSGSAQLVGALAGLTAGVVLAILAARVLCRTRKEPA